MSIFRFHILRHVLILATIATMLPFLLLQQTGSTSVGKVTHWVQNFLDEDATDLREQIRLIEHGEQKPEGVLKKISTLISEHSEAFQIPVPVENPSEEDIYLILLHEWVEHQQNGNGMGATALAERNSKNGFHVEKLYRAAHQALAQNFTQYYLVLEKVMIGITFIRYHLIPLSGGVAIGAP